jgi:MFS family permease
MPAMSGQFALLKTRRFLPMFLTQFLGAFNDNVFKQAMVLLLTFQAADALGLSVSLLNNLAAMLFILPYFLFSAAAGQLADKYAKDWLSVKIKQLELVIMLLASVAFVCEIYWLLFVALFLMGTHSTFFGPVKYAYLPQVLHKDEMVGGNAFFQTGTSMAILTGMMLGGTVIAGSGEHHLIWTSITVVAIALLGWITAKQIPPTPSLDPQLKIDWNVWRTSVQTLGDAWRLPRVFYAIIGISWFWYYGATFLTQIPQFTKELLHGDESVVILLLTLFSIGVATGSLLCRRLLNNQVSLKLLPLGMIGLTVFACDLYFSLTGLSPQATLQSLSQIVGQAPYWRVFVDLAGIGLFGGFYIVPLYAFMQAHAPESHRARIIAANNILNALFMVASAIVALLVLGLWSQSLPQLFVLTAVMNVAVCLLVIRKTRATPVSVSSPH